MTTKENTIPCVVTMSLLSPFCRVSYCAKEHLEIHSQINDLLWSFSENILCKCLGYKDGV